METTIQSLHFDADKKLIDFINEKTAKLETYYDGFIGTDVILRIDKSSTNDNKIVEIKVKTKSKEMFAKKQALSFEEAVDSAVEAIRSQVTKHKGKIAEQA